MDWGPGAGSGAPLSFKHFIASLPHDVPTAQQAEILYRQYLERETGDRLRARHLLVADDARWRSLHHPDAAREAAEARGDEARRASAAFVARLAEAGPEGPALTALAAEGGEGWRQGNAPCFGSAGSGSRAPATSNPAPGEAWTPARVAEDLRIALWLIHTLDTERGAGEGGEDDEGGNPLLAGWPGPPPAAPADAVAPPAAAGAAGDAAAAVSADATATTAPAAGPPPEAPLLGDAWNPPRLAGLGPLPSGWEAAAGRPDDAAAQAAAGVRADAAVVDRLDVALTYLWRVHGVDFYAGAEVLPADFAERLGRDRAARGEPRGPTGAGEAGADDATVVAAGGPRLSEGGEAAAAGGADAAAEGMEADGGTDGAAAAPSPAGADHRADNRGGRGGDRGGDPAERVARRLAHLARLSLKWRGRASRRDPLLVAVARLEARVVARVDAWIASCCERHDEGVWGCTLSAKKFRAVEYVVKHVRLKHAERLAAERASAADAVFAEAALEALAEQDRAEGARRSAGGGAGKGGRAGGLPGRGGGGGARGGGGDGRGRGRGYHDHDAPTNQRELLDYGDL